jgi:hypothetical protein
LTFVHGLVDPMIDHPDIGAIRPQVGEGVLADTRSFSSGRPRLPGPQWNVKLKQSNSGAEYNDEEGEVQWLESLIR